MIHPVTYAVANTLKRSIVVASSLVSQPTPAAGGRGWRRGRELGPARRPLRAESLPPAIPSSRARASFVCAPRCSFSRVYPLLAMPAPSWRSPAPSYTPCTPSLRDRGLSVPTPSPFSLRWSSADAAFRQVRETLRYDLHDRTAFIYSRESRESHPVPVHCLVIARFLSSGFLCARLFFFSRSRARVWACALRDSCAARTGPAVCAGRCCACGRECGCGCGERLSRSVGGGGQ